MKEYLMEMEMPQINNYTYKNRQNSMISYFNSKIQKLFSAWAIALYPFIVFKNDTSSTDQHKI